MMNLRQYLAQANRSQSEFARQIGVSRSYLSEIASGAKLPSLTVAAAIERETGGKVSAMSFIPSKQAS